jgi:hypothetical protein
MLRLIVFLVIMKTASVAGTGAKSQRFQREGRQRKPGGGL